MQSKTRNAIALSLFLLSLGGAARAEDRPAVVELFTSQGCSSCPPADALLGELARRGDVIALAYHVDYWDYLGWKDPFASHAGTERQRLYARGLGLSGIYTPQMVVDGAVDVVGSDRRSVLAALGGPRQGPGIQLLREDGKLKIAVAAQKEKGAQAAEVVLVAYADQAETKVQRGENAGRSLTEYAIVRAVYPLGRWSGDPTRFTIDLAAIAPDATAVAVLVQSPGPGRILGAAKTAIR
jgi:hypothetical protein